MRPEHAPEGRRTEACDWFENAGDTLELRRTGESLPEIDESAGSGATRPVLCCVRCR